MSVAAPGYPIEKVLVETFAVLSTGTTLEQLQDKRDQDKAQVLKDVNEALQNGTLKAYLEQCNPDDLMLKLSSDWSKAPYLEILKVCDARVARPLLCGLTTGAILCNFATVHHAISALNVFNTPDRLPIFIEALKLGRNQYWNSIGIDDLLLRHNNTEARNPFKEQLPLLVYKALEIEYGHRPSNIQSYVERINYRRQGLWIDQYNSQKTEAEKSWADSSAEERKAKKAEFKTAKNKEHTAFLEQLEKEKEQIIAAPLAHAELEYEALLKGCAEFSPLQAKKEPVIKA